MLIIYRVVAAFEKAGIDYAIVGGHAVALHGAVRGTVDLDLIINFKKSAFQAAEKALAELGLIPKLPIKSDDVFTFREEYIRNRNLVAWSFVNPKNPTEIVDIIITHNLKDVKTVRVSAGKTKVKVISLDDLIHMKEESGRPQDEVDIKVLKELKK